MENAELIQSIIWPVVTIILVLGLPLILKNQLSELIAKIEGFQYRKNSEGHEVKASFVSAGLADTKQNLEIANNTDEPNQETWSNPKFSIIEAYNKLEISAIQKLEKLNTSLPKKFKYRPLNYLIYKGAFSPEMENAIQNVQFIRNQVAHSNDANIGKGDVREYLSVIHKIEEIVNALDGLPAMHLNAITMILRNISIILDSNKYQDISINEIHQHIENGTILNFISSFDEAEELKDIMKSDLWKGFDEFYVQSLQSIYHGYAGDERRKWGIQNSGICLLLAWTNEIIQMGSGWYPDTNLSDIDQDKL